MLTSLLRGRDCTESDLFYTASENLHRLSPTAESALNIAILAFHAEKFVDAVEYYQQAINLETNENNKADYYFGLAACHLELNNKEKARTYAQKASALRSNWGEPFILIGQLYASSKNECSSLSLPNSIYWVAVDMFVKAKNIDPSVKEKANKLILSYSNYFPNKEEAFFQDVTEGENYSIGCWINETTTARFND
jgi:tetratricopeptide (TPR) repeat protein